MSGRLRLLIGTMNSGKSEEVRTLLQGLDIELLSLRGFTGIKTANETGRSYSENALLKARSYARQTAMYALADDSGLEVSALGGRPGLFSARYAGTRASDSDRVQQLLAELSATRDDERGASFQCAVAIVDPKGTVLNIGEGTCEGTIAREARGDSGFGYDPVFIPKGYAKTFAELSQDAKDRISHRAKALRITRAFLLEFSSRFKAATLDRDHAAS